MPRRLPHTSVRGNADTEAHVRRSTLARCAVLVCTFVALTGCIGRKPDATKLLASSPTSTREGRTSAFSLSFEFTGIAGAAKPTSLTADGLFDYATRAGHLTMPLASLGLPGLGEGTVAEELITGDVVFIKIPGLGPAGKPWIRVDFAQPTSGAAVAGLQQLGVEDPTAVLGTLAGTTSGARMIGRERVRGAATTHYRATVDLAKARAATKGSAKAQLDRFARKVQVAQLPVDVWLDELGRARRIDYAADVPGGGAGGGAVRMRSRTELYDFGTKVDVTPPPPEQIIDATSLGA